MKYLKEQKIYIIDKYYEKEMDGKRGKLSQIYDYHEQIQSRSEKDTKTIANKSIKNKY